jgi:hypothetical protein
LQFRANCFESVRQWYAIGQSACGARISACGAAEHARCQAHALGQARYAPTHKQTHTLADYLFFYGPILWVCPVLWLRRTTSSFTMVLWYVVTRSYVVTAVRRPVLRFYGSVVCLVLSYAWYVWSYRMPESMVCVVRCYVWIYGMCGLSCVAKHYGSVVCLVLSYAGPYYDGMVCVALSYVAQACDPMVCLVLSYVWICGMSGPILCLDLWYVWSDLMSGPILCLDLWYVWSMDL